MSKLVVTLKDFASYSPTDATTFTIERPVAVFYGPNGAGKSTIARAIRHHGNPTLGPAGACNVKVEGVASPEFCIYDPDYIDETFQQKDGPGIRGIFTLGKKTAEDIAAIEQTQAEEAAETAKILQNDQLLVTLSVRSARALENAKEATWSIKQDYEKGPLRFCLADRKLLSDKGRLFAHLVAVQKADETHVLEELLSEAKDVDDEHASKKAQPSWVALNLSGTETDPTLSAMIAPSSDSRLSPLIKRLQNEDWVREGASHLHESEDQCPFCQQHLPIDFKAEISRMFDEAYKSQLEDVRKLRSSYRDVVSAFTTELTSSAFQDDYFDDLEYQGARAALQLVLERNLAKLDEKANKPGDSVALESSTELTKKWEQSATRIKGLIEAYNNRIANIATTKQRLDRCFWEKMKHAYADTLSTYESELSAIKVEETQARAGRQSAVEAARIARERLKELRKSATNIDASVDSINRKINNLGVTGFTIEKDGANPGYYHIARGSKGKVSYKSLSEGEKTLITFLYFLEALEGSLEETGTANKANRIVVIDDPVSSLSHNHVYDIAGIITHSLVSTGAFPHVIILTHSLFFYHELFKSAPGKLSKTYQCFRVLKSMHSDVRPMARDEITNDYQAHWRVVTEANVARIYSVAVPLAMRYILEHYFSFLGYHSELSVALQQLSDEEQEFRAFYRYINRQLHADEVNISDLPAVDPSIYLDKFKAVFVRTNHEKHFDHMIGTAAP